MSINDSLTTPLLERFELEQQLQNHRSFMVDFENPPASAPIVSSSQQSTHFENPLAAIINSAVDPTLIDGIRCLTSSTSMPTVSPGSLPTEGGSNAATHFTNPLASDSIDSTSPNNKSTSRQPPPRPPQPKFRHREQAHPDVTITPNTTLSQTPSETKSTVEITVVNPDESIEIQPNSGDNVSTTSTKSQEPSNGDVSHHQKMADEASDNDSTNDKTSNEAMLVDLNQDSDASAADEQLNPFPVPPPRKIRKQTKQTNTHYSTQGTHADPDRDNDYGLCETNVVPSTDASNNERIENESSDVNKITTNNNDVTKPKHDGIIIASSNKNSNNDHNDNKMKIQHDENTGASGTENIYVKSKRWDIDDQVSTANPVNQHTNSNPVTNIDDSNSKHEIIPTSGGCAAEVTSASKLKRWDIGFENIFNDIASQGVAGETAAPDNIQPNHCISTNSDSKVELVHTPSVLTAPPMECMNIEDGIPTANNVSYSLVDIEPNNIDSEYGGIAMNGFDRDGIADNNNDDDDVNDDNCCNTSYDSDHNNSLLAHHVPSHNGFVSNQNSASCSICLEPLSSTTDPTLLRTLQRCHHTFHVACIAEWFSRWTGGAPKCPNCQLPYGRPKGNQPENGRMWVRTVPGKVPGYKGVKGVIKVRYQFPDGIQGDEHPRPGRPYKGTSRVCFLPNNEHGQKVANLLRLSFDCGTTFTIGTSATTGQKNVVIWNGVHHKTSIGGGPSNYGYPDSGYLSRVEAELAGLGITDDTPNADSEDLNVTQCCAAIE